MKALYELIVVNESSNGSTSTTSQSFDIEFESYEDMREAESRMEAYEKVPGELGGNVTRIYRTLTALTLV